MNWLILSVLSVATASVSRILQKVLLRGEKSNPYAFGFVFQTLIALFFLTYVLITKTWEFPNLSDLGLNVVIMCIFYALANVMLFKAFQKADASDVSVIMVSGTMWSVIGSVLILGERLTPKGMLGIALIIVGVLVLQNINVHTFRLKKAHVYAILSAFFYGFAFVNDVFLVKRYNTIPSYLFIAFLLPAFTILLFDLRSIREIPQYVGKRKIGKMLICSFFYALSALFAYTAYKSGGQASLIATISQTSVVFVVILSYVFLKEREQVVNKVIGTLFALSGVLLLI